MPLLQVDQKARIPVDYYNPLLRIPARRQTAGRAS
jgi:hypothetical protein